MEGSSEESSMIAIHPSVEEKTNIMTLEELNALRDTYSFSSGVQVRLPDEGEIITSTRQASSFPTLGEALLALWRCGGYINIPSPFPSLGTYLASIVILNRIKAGYTSRRGTKKFCSEDTPAMLRGGKASSSSSLATNGRFLKEHLRRASQEFRGCGEFQISTAIIHPDFTTTKRKFLKRFFGRSSSRDASPYPCYWIQNRIAEYLSLLVLGRLGRRAIIFRAEKHRAHRAMWVLDPILDRSLNAPSSNSSSKSCSDSSLPIELESDAMSKRVSFKKIGEKLGKITGASSGTPVPAKEVVIGEKRAGESITSSPTSAAPTVVPSRPRERTSAHLGTVTGPTPSILGSPSVAERLLRGVIPQADKEKVEKLTLDQTATKLFHVIGQALVLGSSLAIRSREAGEQASLQEGRSRAHEQQANDELAKMKSDRELLTDKLERSNLLVNELREALDKAKESAVEEFKSSSEFMVAIEDSASKYFGKGFDFCKVQLRQQHPDLAIDLEGTMVNQDLLAEQDEVAEEREKENLGENKGCCFSYYFNVNGDHELGDENSLGDIKLATSLTAIRTPIIL
ncbi:hypothetical protein Acr_13g0003890 [Actinidia rufa]|uniref:Uncharacterized protein n=1 Tax=Actinidia rufa TaxID=165716 RepID=A0A7J0FJW5_9ERIC|nr:hypothetical protein Acr_13g0003890 [Actinidia rufa]